MKSMNRPLTNRPRVLALYVKVRGNAFVFGEVPKTPKTAQGAVVMVNVNTVAVQG